MAAHDAESYVGEAIDSILEQTFEDFELIVVNDASTDGTAAVIRRKAELDRRVVTIDVDLRNSGEARNVGMRHADAELIALMDADDVAYPDRLRTQYEAAVSRPNVVVWGAYMQRMTQEGLPMSAVRVGCPTPEEFRDLDRTTSLIRCYATVAMLRRDVALRVGGFDPAVEPLGDSELWDRMAAFGPILVVPRILQDYRQHDMAISVRRIERQRTMYQFITQRYRARSAGRDLTLQEFERIRGAMPAVWRYEAILRGVSQRHGRRFHIALARKEYLRSAGYGVLAVLTHPGRFLRRLLPAPPHV